MQRYINIYHHDEFMKPSLPMTCYKQSVIAYMCM